MESKTDEKKREGTRCKWPQLPSHQTSSARFDVINMFHQHTFLFIPPDLLFIRFTPLSTKPIKTTLHTLCCSNDMSFDRGKDLAHHGSSGDPPPSPSRYESQKRRDWNTFTQYLRNQRPPVHMSQCNSHHVLEFLRYLDQFGKTKVHLQGCIFYGHPEPPAPCACPLRQAWGSLDSLIGRLRAAYEESGGSTESSPFATSVIRIYLREVKECQAKARGIPCKKKKKATKAGEGSSTST